MPRFAVALVYALNLLPVQAFAAVVEGPDGEPVPTIAPLKPLEAPLAAPLSEIQPLALPAAPAIEPLSAAAAPPQAAQAAAPAEKPSVAGRLRAFAASARAMFARPAAAETDRARVDFTLNMAPRDGGVEPVVPAYKGESASPQTLTRPPSGEGPRKAARGVRAYVAGTFGAQLANNALQVTLPLLLIQVSGPAAAAWVTGVATLLDTAGTLVGGWLSTRASPAKVLVISSLARALAVAAIPVVLLTHAPGVAALAAIACVDALARGVADTSRKTVPTILASDSDGLKKINSAYQTAFEAGGVAGPALVGLLMTHLGGAAAQWIAPAAFAAIAAVYSFIPHGNSQLAPERVENQKPGDAKPAPGRGSWLPKAVVATALLTLYPLKGVLPAVFASGVLHSPSAAAWLAAAFGAGGVLGARVYARWNKKLPLSGWLKAGALGSLLLAAAWLPGSVYFAAAGVLGFAVLNSAARVAQDSDIMEKAQGPDAGKAIGWARFASNLSSASLRFLVGGAFALAGGHGGWWLVAAGLAGIGALAWWNASSDKLVSLKKLLKYWWIGASLVALFALHSVLPAIVLGFGLMVSPRSSAAARPSPVHGMPGRLIVVEGLDGSGKSTQLERLKDHLESQGLKVVTTSWNSSELLSDTVKKAKAERALDARTFALLNAADLNERLEREILPALRGGAVVLADRWFFTALARDSVRGNDPEWLRSLYKDVPRPDLTLYFKLPVATAIQRVLKRAGGKTELSEDFDESRAAKVLGQNYYAVGRDLDFAADDEANFREFQTRVTASYDAQLHEYGFRPVDATKDRDAQEASIARFVDRFLGPVESFAPRDEKARWNIFDKDPAGDAPNIRRNYLHEKKGAHFYFRNALLPMQERFAQLLDLRTMPKVFLHGSPHVDNYAKTANGAAMVDFDRSRVGPYAWDLVRLMVSISLRQKKDRGFLDDEVLRQLKKGYLHGLRHPEKPFSEMRKLKNKEPEDDETSVNAYLAANKKWAKEMRGDPMGADSPKIESLVKGYLANNGERRSDWTIEEAGRGEGSMGFRAIYLVVLKHKDPKRDRLLLNFKQVRTDPDTEWYKNPYGSETERMLEAAKLYAPGWELAPGWVELDGVEYYVRGIPPQNAKLKKMLSRDEQEDFAYSVGTQLGRAHALSLKDGVTTEQLERRFREEFEKIAAAGATIKDEILAAHERYLKKMKKDGLEPEDSVAGDE